MRWPWKKKKTVTVGAGRADGAFDQYSPTWLFIEKHIEEELQKLRIKNDSLKNDEIKTASLRGEIARLKMLAKLPERI